MGTLKLNKQIANNETRQINVAENSSVEKADKMIEEQNISDINVENIELCELAKQDEGFVEEFENLRTANETVYRRNDRTCRKIITAAPTRYVDDNNEIKNISNRLIDNGKEIINEANSFKVKFNKDAQNGKIFELRKGAKSLTLSAVGSAKTRNHTCGCKCELCADSDNKVSVTLDNGTEIQYLTLNDRIKENIIVKERQESYEYNFTLDIGDLTVEEGENNDLLLKDASTGETEFIIPAPFMFDAEKKYSDKVRYEIDVNDNELLIKVVADAEFINASERKFPVTIDPMFIIDSLFSPTCWTISNDGYGATDKYYKNVLEIYALKGSQATKRAQITVPKPELNIDDTAVLQVQLQISSKAAGSGYFTINNSSTKYQAVRATFIYDCTAEYKAAKVGDTLSFNINPLLGTSDKAELEFNTTDERPKILISYQDVKPDTSIVKPCYKKISLTDCAEGFLNVADGDITAVIQDKIFDGLTLPMNLNHIYKLGYGKSYCGTDWRLNINKKLLVSDSDNNTNTRYTFIDELGNYYTFAESYYYLENGVCKFLSKEKVTYDISGGLLYGDKNVFTCQVCNGYTLISEINDFVDANLIQQKSDEQINLEEQIKAYENALSDYVLISDTDYNILKELDSLDKTDYESFIGLAGMPIKSGYAPCYVAVTKSTAQQLMSLSLSVEQLSPSGEDKKDDSISAKQINNFNKQIEYIISKAKSSLSSLKENFATYYSKKAQLRLLLLQTPKNFLQDNNGIISGFNVYGNLVYVSDSYGKYVAIEYDTEDKIISITDDKGKQVRFEYCNGLLQSITNSRGMITKYAYDTKNRLQSILYADNRQIDMTYASNRLATLSTSENLQTRLSYTDGLLSRVLIKNIDTSTNTVSDIKIERASGSVTIDLSNSTYEKYYFDTDGRLIRFEQIDNTDVIKTTDYTYDFSNGNKITSVTSDNIDSPVISVVENYNIIDRLINKTQDWVNISENVKVKIVEDYTYDTLGRLTNITLTKSINNSGKVSATVAVTNYFYNAHGSLILTENYVKGEELISGKNYEERVLDDDGKIIRTIVWNSLDSSTKFYSEQVYADNGMVAADKNEEGNVSAEYEYVNGTNVINSVKYPNGSRIAYGRNPFTFDITSVTQSTDIGESNTTDICYDKGRIVKVNSCNTALEYEYDFKGRKTQTKVNGITQAANSYNDNYSYSDDGELATISTITQTQYNGAETVTTKICKMAKLDEDYSILKPLVNVTINNETVNSKTFNYKGNLHKEYNNILGESSYNAKFYTVYSYDDFDNIIGIATTIGQPEYYNLEENYAYDELGYLISRTVSTACEQSYSYFYKNSAAHNLDYISFGNYKFKPLTDVNGRNIGKEIYNGANKFAAEYISYRKVGDRATNMPSTIWYLSGSNVQDNIRYKYDNCGNIVKIIENNNLAVRYEYDMLNRLAKEDNKILGKVYEYVYDANGNILYKYTKSNGQTVTDKYEYDGDKLLSYNGEKCEYNSLGNPTKYRDKEVGWLYGKFLTDYDGNKFVYDSRGRRIRKNEFQHIYDDAGNLICIFGKLQFVYDNSSVIGVIHNETQYFYRKDVQGNIIAILDESGAVVVKYVYDAWGNHAVLDANGNDIDDAEHIGNLNPFRYRGYYYDVETGLYYLQTRYYDPETGRFISQDSVEYATPTTINGLNLYAYCGNNPVMGYDPTGTIDWGKVRDWFSTITGLFNGISKAMAGGALLVAICEGRWNDILTDFSNGCFNPFNQDESIALNSKVFSFYKGEAVIRHNISGASSCQVFGTIFLNSKAIYTTKGIGTLNHEFGHGIQERLMGVSYLIKVALPSVITYASKVNNYTYYSMPWERTADLFGGVNRSIGYKPNSVYWALAENFIGIGIIPFYLLFGY